LGWNNFYYRGIKHFLWEPQRIGHQRRAESTGRLDEIMARVRRLETSLNNVLEVYFALAPSRFTLEILGEGEATYELVSVNAGDLKEHTSSVAAFFDSFCQPDLFFVGPTGFARVSK
jgi:hypothetical protein